MNNYFILLFALTCSCNEAVEIEPALFRNGHYEFPSPGNQADGEYISATPMIDGFACVQLRDMSYRVVSKQYGLIEEVISEMPILVKAKMTITQRGPIRYLWSLESQVKQINLEGNSVPISISSDGIVKIKFGDFFGYSDKQGKELISPQFVKASDFHMGVARVHDGSAWKYINVNGTYINSSKYLEANDFVDEITTVMMTKGSISTINNKGEVIKENIAEGDWATECRNGLFFVMSGDSAILLDRNGVCISVFPAKDLVDFYGPNVVLRDKNNNQVQFIRFDLPAKVGQPLNFSSKSYSTGGILLDQATFWGRRLDNLQVDVVSLRP